MRDGRSGSQRPRKPAAQTETARGDAEARLRQRLSAAAERLRAPAAAAQWRVLRSRSAVPSGWLLVPPELAEGRKATLVAWLSRETSGTWCSARVDGGWRCVHVANACRAQRGGRARWERLHSASDSALERAVFAAIATSELSQAEGSAAARTMSIGRRACIAAAPYHLGEGVGCKHSPFGAVVSDAWLAVVGEMALEPDDDAGLQEEGRLEE